MDRLKDAASILRRCRFFAAVQGESFEHLVRMAQSRAYPRGRIIFRQDDPCPGVFVLGEGLVRIFKMNPNGKEHVLHLVGAGGTFAEVAAIGGFACPAFAEALEDSACVLLPGEAFNAALRQDHALCLGLMGSMTLWVRQLVGLMEDIALRDAAGRVARYLLSVAGTADGAVRLPSLKKHLASHLNLTSETLSRTLRRLTDEGLIDSAGEQDLTVRDRKGLEAVAEGGFPMI